MKNNLPDTSKLNILGTAGPSYDPAFGNISTSRIWVRMPHKLQLDDFGTVALYSDIMGLAARILYSSGLKPPALV